MAAEPLTIALILEATDNASEWIDRVRENVESLAEAADAASKAVADGADQMTTALEGTDEASTATADAIERQAAISDQAAASMQALTDSITELTAATERQTLATTSLGEKAAATSTSMASLNKAANYLGLAFLGAAAIGIKMAMDFQKSTATLEGNADITANAANRIGNAFLNAGGQTEFTANQMMQAFAPVAGAFVNLYGRALDVKQSMDVMNASMTLAEASGTDLTSATAAVTNVMTAFHLSVTQAAGAANTLYNSSRLLGVSNDTLATSIQRLEPKIAGSGISLVQLTGFMDEFSKSAGNGRTAVRLAGTMIQGLVSPSSSAAQELAILGINVDNSKGKFIGLNTMVAKLHDALAKLPATSNLVREAQTAYRLEMEKASLATGPQTTLVKSQISALSSQISALGDTTKALSQSSVMTALFGKNSALATQLIAEGLPTLQASEAAVAKQGTAAKAAAIQQKTFEGMLKKVKSAAEALFIKLGQHLLPVMVRMAQDAIKIVDAIIKWTDGHKTLTKFIVGTMVALVGLIKLIEIATALTKAYAAAQVLLDAAMDANPFGLVIAAIALLVGEIILLVKYWRQIYDAGIDTRIALEKAWDDVATWFNNNIIQPIVGFFKTMWDDIYNAGVVTHVAIVNAWNDVASWFDSEVIQPIERFFTGLWNGITAAAKDTWNAVVDVWDVVSSWFNSNVIQPIVELFVNLWKGVSTGAVDSWHAIETAWDVVSSWFDSEVIEPVERFFVAMWDDVVTAARTAWHDILSVWDAVSSWFDSNVIHPIEAFFDALWGLIETGATSAWNGIARVWDAVSSWFDTTIIQPIESFFSTLWQDIVNGATDAVDKIESAFKGVGNFLNTVSGGLIGDFGKVLGLATGGIVNSPTLAVVGEAGPEMVIPLSNIPGGAASLGGGGVSPLPSLGSSGGNTIIQVNVTLAGQVYGSLDQLANALGRQLATITVPGAGTRLTTR